MPASRMEESSAVQIAEEVAVARVADHGQATPAALGAPVLSFSSHELGEQAGRQVVHAEVAQILEDVHGLGAPGAAHAGHDDEFGHLSLFHYLLGHKGLRLPERHRSSSQRLSVCLNELSVGAILVAPHKHGYPARKGRPRSAAYGIGVRQDAIGQLFFLLVFPLIILRRTRTAPRPPLRGRRVAALISSSVAAFRFLNDLKCFISAFLRTGPSPPRRPEYSPSYPCRAARGGT